jgi:RNA polymerase sigma-70 factor (ECF subfamily)
MCRRRMVTASTRAATELAEVQPGDHDLLRRVANGDTVAFGLLADRISPVLKRVLHRLGLASADVEDLAQETLIRIWHASPGFRGRSSVATWACRIALNLAISHLRRTSRGTVAEPQAEADPSGQWEAGNRAEHVRRAVLDLPVNLRTVIILREFEDRSYREMAEILEVPIGTVMSRLHEARGRLRRVLVAAI